MSDDRVRSLERAWRASGTAEDEARLVLERLRSGLVPSSSVEVAASLGHAPSCAALGREPAPELKRPESAEEAMELYTGWLGPALALGPAACARVAVAGAREGRYHWERFDGPEDRLLGGLDALDEWIREPGPMALSRVNEAYQAIVEGSQGAGPWMDWGMANAILEALQVASEEPLALEHARRAILETVAHAGDRLQDVHEGVRREVSEWVLGLSDPVKDRERVLGLRLGREPDIVRGVAFSPDGRRVASSSRAGTATIWSVDLRRRVLDLPRQSGEVFGLAFTPDGRLLTGTSHGALRLWDSTTGAPLAELEDGHPGGVRALAVLDDETAVTAGDDRRLVVRDLPSLRVRAERAGDGERIVAALATSPDRATIAVAVGPVVRLHDARDLRVVCELEGHGSDVDDLAFTPDGERLLSAGGYDRSVKVRDLATRAVVTSFGDDRPIRRLALTPDGRRVATGGDGDLHLASVATGERAQTWRWPGVLLALAGSPVEPLFASGSRSGALRLWRPEHSTISRS